MKTKKIIILTALLLSGIIVSAQAYSDNSNMKIRHDQTSQPLIEISEIPSDGANILTSYDSWWQLLKLYIVPGMVSNKAIDTGHENSYRSINLKRKDRRILPPLPGPNRHRATKSNNVNSNQ